MECQFNDEKKEKEKDVSQKKELYSCDRCGRKYIKTSYLCLCPECNDVLEAYFREEYLRKDNQVLEQLKCTKLRTMPSR